MKKLTSEEYAIVSKYKNDMRTQTTLSPGWSRNISSKELSKLSFIYSRLVNKPINVNCGSCKKEIYAGLYSALLEYESSLESLKISENTEHEITEINPYEPQLTPANVNKNNQSKCKKKTDNSC